MFAYQDSLGGVEVAFTDRHGGTSGGPYASLNLATGRGDDRADGVEANLALVTSAFTEPATEGVVWRMHQVHGADVAVVDEVAAQGEPPAVDALVTALPGVVLLVRVADCVPVLLADPDAGVVGAAHAGRPGMVAGVVPRTVEAMRALGATRLRAWVGPHVCGGCYEVPEQMRAEVCTVVPQAWAQTTWGTPALDIGAGVRAQLDDLGVDGVDVEVSDRCTLEDEDLYSYRRQGRESGRLGGLVWVRP